MIVNCFGRRLLPPTRDIVASRLPALLFVPLVRLARGRRFALALVHAILPFRRAPAFF